MEDTLIANEIACSQVQPSESFSASPAVKASPAAVVSTALQIIDVLVWLQA